MNEPTSYRAMPTTLARGPAPEQPQRRSAPVTVLGVALALALLGAGLRATERPVRGSFRAPPGQLPAVVTPGPRPAPAVDSAALSPDIPAGPIGARVGVQVGHWRSEELPDELALLREQRGGNAAGFNEVVINLEIAQQVAAILATRGVTVDILPATIPPGYQADAFIAIHCDVNNDPTMHGYKLARFRHSPNAARDDALIVALGASYAASTGQARDPLPTRAMTGYYAFNAQDFRHAIAPQTPAAIIELGFLTNDADRALLTARPQLAARGIAEGLLRFLIAPG